MMPEPSASAGLSLRRLVRPGTILLVVLVLVFTGLGVWQLRRGAWKAALLAAIAAAERAPPMELTDAILPLTRVAVTGMFRDGVARLGADARERFGRTATGSDVVQVLDRAGRRPVLVDRGWAADGDVPEAGAGPQAVVGYVLWPEGAGAIGGSADPARNWFPTFDGPDVADALQAPDAVPVLVVAIGPDTSYPVPAASVPRPPDNHLQYALTWFGLAACTVAVALARMRRVAPVLLLLLALLSGRAQAETTVRLGDGLSLQPYVLEQLDEAGFNQSRGEGQAAGFNARRLRLGSRLDIQDQVRLGFVWDFGHLPGGQGALFEAQASYIGFKPFTATVGVFKTDFSLESMQGAGDYLMLERASIVTITRNLAAGIRREGVQLMADGERYNVALAGTAGRAGPGDDGNQRAVVGRAAGLAVRSDALSVHLGVSGEWVMRPASAKDAAPSLSLSDGPEVSVDDTPSPLATGRISARRGGAAGPELGLSWRRLWLQGEYYAVLVERSAAAGGGTLHFDGWYAQAAYTVLGTPRRWSGSTGAWGAPKPSESFNPRQGGFGAIEAGVRFSTVNLNSLNVQGGRQSTAALSLSWWPVEQLRFTAIAEHVTVRGGDRPRSSDAFGGRAQLQF